MSLNLEQEILSELTTELKDSPEFNEDVLSIKVRNAIREVKSRREYGNSSYSEDQVEEDLYKNYYTTVYKLALYYYMKRGADFQNSHSENGISRSWNSEDDILRNVHAFVKVLA